MDLKTVLHQVHIESGARMVPFGGWDMPVQYAGIISEVAAVRTKSGLFDVSHMGVIELQGSGSTAMLQKALANSSSLF